MRQRTFKKLTHLLVATGISVAATVGIAAPAQATSCPVNPAGLASNSTYFCDFRGWDFSGLGSFSNIDFSISYLENTNFTGATLSNIQIANNSNHNMNFTNANVTGFNNALSVSLVDLSNSTFANANFTNGNFHFAHLDGSDMTGMNLTGANLNNAFLTNANLTGATVTQQQLAVAVLSSGTVCPDGYTLGVHTGDCFSPLVALTPVLSAPVLTTDGYTFSVTNYNEEYTFTAVMQTGVGVPTIGSPTGSNLPISVTGVPSGSNAVVAVTSTIGAVSSTSTTSNALANTSAPQSTTLWSFGLLGAALLSAGVFLITGSRKPTAG